MKNPQKKNFENNNNFNGTERDREKRIDHTDRLVILKTPSSFMTHLDCRFKKKKNTKKELSK